MSPPRRPAATPAQFIGLKHFRVLQLLLLLCPGHHGNLNISASDCMIYENIVVQLRQGSGKDWQGMAVKAKGVKA